MRGVRLAELPSYSAGQALKIFHDGVAAYFAIASAYGKGRAPELLLRRGGGVAEGLIASLRPGATIDYDGPGGPGFPLEHARGRDVLLVAAGSGLSAIRAVVDVLLDERAAYGRIALFYGQEREDDLAYAAHRQAWAAAGVDVTECLHGDEPRWSGARGFVQDVIIARGPGVRPEAAVAYLCGMPGMIEGVREALEPLGLPSERTYLNL